MPDTEQDQFGKPATEAAGSTAIRIGYAAFLARSFAHRARCAAAILRRAAADIVRFAGAVFIAFPVVG